jgi:hypothetical protein
MADHRLPDLFRVIPRVRAGAENFRSTKKCKPRRFGTTFWLRSWERSLIPMLDNVVKQPLQYSDLATPCLMDFSVRLGQGSEGSFFAPFLGGADL